MEVINCLGATQILQQYTNIIRQCQQYRNNLAFAWHTYTPINMCFFIYVHYCGSLMNFAAGTSRE